jgi:hypothetical protein
MHTRVSRPQTTRRHEIATGAVSAVVGAAAGWIIARGTPRSATTPEATPNDPAWHLALRSSHPPQSN